MPIAVSAEEAKAFAETMKGPDYAGQERDYKLAVHTVLSRLLSSPAIDSPQFPHLLKSGLEGDVDFNALGLGGPQDGPIRAQAAGFANDFANLSGGRWGVAQYVWLLPAVEMGLGEALRGAFKAVVDTNRPLAERVDRFREELYEIQKQLRDKGGFKKGWNLLNPALGFVAAVLGGYDPRRYVYYHATRLRRAIEELGGEWPEGTAGQRYEGVCKLVREVASALTAHGVPVRDLIDAQSFLWLKGKETSVPASPEKKSQEPLPRPGPRGSAAAALSVAEMTAELAAKTFWDPDRAERLIKVAQRSKQLLFYGPPGTGKTYVALILARLLAGEQEEGHVKLTQFHPSYAYEDFVEGIRPKLSGEDTLGYEVRKGILRRLIDQAREFPEERFFLIVDEMNRANLPRVFGELLLGLEYRGPEYPIDLPYSEEVFYIPHNFWLIGTMNTADRSIASVDAALRRRFTHIEFAPDTRVLKRWLEARGLGSLAQDAVRRLDTLNAELEELLDSDRLVGHSYLMRTDLADVGFQTVWLEGLAPVLREHLFSRPEELARLRTTFLGSE
jgi:MoxR-like ATPase